MARAQSDNSDILAVCGMVEGTYIPRRTRQRRLTQALALSLDSATTKNHLHHHLPFLPFPVRTICINTFPSYQQEPFAPPPSLPTNKNHLHHHLPFLPPQVRTIGINTFPSYHQEPFVPPPPLPNTKNHLHHHLPFLPPRTICTTTFPPYH